MLGFFYFLSRSIVKRLELKSINAIKIFYYYYLLRLFIGLSIHGAAHEPLYHDLQIR